MEEWEKSEEWTASNFSGNRIPGSGAGDDKLDIAGGGNWEGWLIENKHTTKDSFGLKKSTLKKARSQAINMGKNHFLLIHFKDKPMDLRYVLIEESEFLRLTEK